jgi:uncharacterized protein with NRDE domain
VNSEFVIESNRDEFFQRLYLQHEKKKKSDILKAIEVHKKITEIRNKKQLTIKEADAVVER